MKHHTIGNKSLAWNEFINYANANHEATEADMEEGAHSMQEEKSNTLMTGSCSVAPNGEFMTAIVEPDFRSAMEDSIAAQTDPEEAKLYLGTGKLEETEE